MSRDPPTFSDPAHIDVYFCVYCGFYGTHLSRIAYYLTLFMRLFLSKEYFKYFQFYSFVDRS